LTFVKYEAEFLDIYNNLVEIPDPDKKKHKEVREEAIEKGRSDGLKPTEITWTPPIIEADFGQIICWFANNVGIWNLDENNKSVFSNPESVGYALKAIRAFQSNTNGLVTIEEKALDWLKGQLNEHGSKAFTGVTSALLLERLSDVVEGEPPKPNGRKPEAI